MRALTFQGKRSVKLETVSDPELHAPTDVLVRIRLAGICGSDLHAYHEREKGLDHGTVMGHEFTGEVAEVGADVSGLRVGDRVAGPFTTNCGACFYCRKGLTCRCEKGELFGWVENGRGLQGTQAEWLRVPRSHIETRKWVSPLDAAVSHRRPPRKAARAATTGTSRRGITWSRAPPGSS